MGGSSEDGSSGASKATVTDTEAHKPWIKEKVLGTGGFGTVTLWKNDTTGETIGKVTIVPIYIPSESSIVRSLVYCTM